MEQFEKLEETLNDRGVRESQLKMMLTQCRERIVGNLEPKKVELPEPKTSNFIDQVKETVREDILQIERELIEGWLGSVNNFDKWEEKVKAVSIINLIF